MRAWAFRLTNLHYPSLQTPAAGPENAPAVAPIPRPIQHFRRLSPSEEHAAIPWQEVLGAGPDAPKLSLAKTEDQFLDSDTSAGLVIDRV
jgi:hypothetical protein